MRSACATVLVALLLVTVAAVGASGASTVPTADPCDHACSNSQSIASSDAMDVGDVGGDSSADGWEAPCVMDPGCGGAHAQGHGATGLVAAAHGGFQAPQPPALAVGAPMRGDLPTDQLATGTESPPPRLS